MLFDRDRPRHRDVPERILAPGMAVTAPTKPTNQL